MFVCTEIKACCLYGKVWPWKKYFDTHKDGRQATENLRKIYGGAGKVNKRV